MPVAFEGVTNWSHSTSSSDSPATMPVPLNELDRSQKEKTEREFSDGDSTDASEPKVKSTRDGRGPIGKLISAVKPIRPIKIDDEEKSNDTAAKNQNLLPLNDPGQTQSNVQRSENDSNAANTVLLTGGGWRADTSEYMSSAALARFELFQDPTLSELINQAIAGNQELRVLAEDVQISYFEVQARSGAYRPFVDYVTGVGVEKSGRLTRDGAVESQLEGRPGRDFPDPVPDFLVGTRVSWEIDIWKKLRNAQRAAAMRYLGTQEGRNYVVTRLVAEVSEAYFELLALDNRLVALNQTIEIQSRSLKIAQAKKEAARETELAVQRFRAEVQKNLSQRQIIEQTRIEVENDINKLLGRYPQPIERPSVDFVAIDTNSMSTGLPPELLRNRADIRQAEREISAAGLDVQVARARFYPSLGIRAGVGYRAFDARYLFTTPDSLIYNVAGDLMGPLINKRAIQADYKTANARQLQSVYNYQQTVINAFTEVVNYMSKVENYGQSIQMKKQQLASLEASVDAANKLFENARAEYMEVLLAQRDYMEARMVLIETKQEQLIAMVNAYRALGGGCF